MNDDIYKKKVQEQTARGEFEYARIDPDGYIQRHGQWPEETDTMRSEREAAQRSADLESVRIAEYDRKGPMPRPLSEEERKQKELEDRLSEVRGVDALNAQAHAIASAPDPKFANPYDNRQAQEAMERITEIHRKEDAPKKDILEELKASLPPSSAELKAALKSLDFRLDLMKDLVECYAQRVNTVTQMHQEDFSPEASAEVNKAVSDYADLLSTLSSCGYNFGSSYNSYTTEAYDPYKPEMNINVTIEAMFKRRRGGCDINIQVPKNYDNSNPRPSADAVTIFHYLDEELKHNPDMAYAWDRLEASALKNFNAARASQVSIDQQERANIINNTLDQNGPKL